MIYATLIVQNGEAEILRALDSVYPVVDEIHIVDGGSTDHTVEVLERFKKSYGLHTYHHPFERIDLQRNWLLEKVPKNSWIVNIDQDEQLTRKATNELREFILKSGVGGREWPTCITLPLINLKTPTKMRTDNCYNNNKIFYYEDGLQFVRPYHSHISFFPDLEDYHRIDAPDGMAVLHYAQLDARRHEDLRGYSPEEWDPESPELPLHNIFR